LNKLQTLNLSSCYSLTKSSLVGLNNLQMLNLSNCASLREIGGLSGLLNLRSLDLGGCQSLSDISSLSGLYNLQTLDLGRCGNLVDISGLSGLVNLQWLELLYLSLSDISSLSGLVNLQSLNLSNCHSLTDISGLAGLVNLQALDLSSCISVTDISSLSGLLNLKWLDISLESQPLNMRFNGSREDISSLSGLVNLQSLNLSNCTSLSDISRLSGLVNLQSLDLYNCVSLTDISSLSGLLNLQSLNLSLCISVTDINSLAGLVKLQSLDLHYCKSLTDINSLSGLVKLQTLNLSDCKSLTDISSLAGLFNLQSLNLRDCESLTDISSLSNLVYLQSIDLSCCRLIVDINNLSGLFNLQILDLSFDPLFKKSHEGLTEIKSLSGLINLQTLSLRYCHSISDISSLSGLLNLQSLNLEECKRIKSYLPLRNCLRLKDLNESKMHPAELAELLCFLAVQRNDIICISNEASSWLKELELGFDQNHPSTNDLACSLAQGIVLANLDEVGLSFHQTLLNHPNVGLAPWKIWFSENLKAFGWDKIQNLAELSKPSELTFGAIGGISSCLPSMESAPVQIAWAKKWISEIHFLHNNNPNFLKPAAAEWCLALKRLGKDQLLREWIEKFTDPSDPSALDPINKVFSAYAIDLNDSQSALDYALKINDPKLRDESILNLAQQFIKESETTMAGEFLFLLTQIESKTQIAYSLAEDAVYLKSDENAHRLLAACGDNLQSLASILDKLRLANPNSEILKIMHEKLSNESGFSLSDEAIALEAIVVISKLSKVTDSTFLNEAKKAMETLLKNKPNYV
jgi:Leucine-rich repeat (LRR) protein